MRTYVVGTARAEIETESKSPVPFGVRHAVDSENGKVACDAPDLVIFFDVAWDAHRTAPLCQDCLRALAGWV